MIDLLRWLYLFILVSVGAVMVLPVSVYLVVKLGVAAYFTARKRFSEDELDRRKR